MAMASGVTLRIELDRLPLLPGAAELAAAGNRTRASDSNRGRYMGLLNLASAFAFVISAPLGSSIYSRYGSATLWVL